jgi:hypothetical protein
VQATVQAPLPLQVEVAPAMDVVQFTHPGPQVFGVGDVHVNPHVPELHTAWPLPVVGPLQTFPHAPQLFTSEPWTFVHPEAQRVSADGHAQDDDWQI